MMKLLSGWAVQRKYIIWSCVTQENWLYKENKRPQKKKKSGQCKSTNEHFHFAKYKFTINRMDKMWKRAKREKKSGYSQYSSSRIVFNSNEFRELFPFPVYKTFLKFWVSLMTLAMMAVGQFKSLLMWDRPVMISGWVSCSGNVGKAWWYCF